MSEHDHSEKISLDTVENGISCGLNTAEPPEEVVTLLESSSFDQKEILGWWAVPSLSAPSRRIASREILSNGQVDAHDLILPLLGNPLLDETLRTMDVLNGCGHQCDTCFADAALPSRMFSLSSLEKLFSDDRFLQMLQSDSLRFGSSGDLLDHPDGVAIAELALRATDSLDRKRQENKGKRFKIKVFTNYRPNTEEKLVGLIELAKQYPERMQLVISLPFNKTDIVNQKFADFVRSMPELFGEGHKMDDDLILSGLGITNLKNVNIQDVRHPQLLFMIGRVLSGEANANRVPEYDMVYGDREKSFAMRGLVKTYFNPDALWLMAYVTPYESHTGRTFTPLTPGNIDVLSQLPYHPDFPTPPNWPGGKGEEKNWRIADEMKKKASENKPIRPLKVVH